MPVFPSLASVHVPISVGCVSLLIILTVNDDSFLFPLPVAGRVGRGMRGPPSVASCQPFYDHREPLPSARSDPWELSLSFSTKRQIFYSSLSPNILLARSLNRLYRTSLSPSHLCSRDTVVVVNGSPKDFFPCTTRGLA